MPSTAAETEWDGVCACGKAEMDGKRCALGATHQPLSEDSPRTSDTLSLEDLLA